MAERYGGGGGHDNGRGGRHDLDAMEELGFVYHVKIDEITITLSRGVFVLI